MYSLWMASPNYSTFKLTSVEQNLFVSHHISRKLLTQFCFFMSKCRLTFWDLFLNYISVLWGQPVWLFKANLAAVAYASLISPVSLLTCSMERWFISRVICWQALWRGLVNISVVRAFYVTQLLYSPQPPCCGTKSPPPIHRVSGKVAHHSGRPFGHLRGQWGWAWGSAGRHRPRPMAAGPGKAGSPLPTSLLAFITW